MTSVVPHATAPLSGSALQQLRRHIAKQRRQSSRFAQQRAAQRVLAQFRFFLDRTRQSIMRAGIYLDAFGEIRTQVLIQECFKRNIKVFLPKVCAMNQRLVWVEISKHQYQNHRFTKHRLGMYEPMATRGQPISKLDLVIMPLVICDTTGSRVGMGGGFYDKTLSIAPKRPIRLGLAHEFQYVAENIQRAPWDQSLDALVTPKKCYIFKRPFKKTISLIKKI